MQSASHEAFRFFGILEEFIEPFGGVLDRTGLHGPGLLRANLDACATGDALFLINDSAVIQINSTHWACLCANAALCAFFAY